MRKKSRSKLTLFDDKYINKYVTSSKDIYRGKFHKEGLYSEQIFGPVKDFTCQCGIYNNTTGGTCPKCGVQYISSMKRSTELAKIKLPINIVNPLFLWVINVRRPSNYYEKIFIELLKFKKYLILMPDDSFELLDFETYSTKLEESSNRKIGADAIKAFTDILLKSGQEDKIPNRIRKRYKIYKDEFVIDEVIVAPPDLRPIIISNNNTIITDDTNKIYSKLITKIEILNKNKYLRGIDDFTVNNYISLQNIVSQIYKTIFSIFTGKKGILRGNILGKRIDMSGRAVITPDPSIKFNEAKISYYILLEIYKFHISRLVSRRENKMFNTVLNDIDKCLREKDLKYIDYVKEITDGEVVLLNRQPTLHKHGIQGFFIKVTPDNTIKIHPMVCPAFNADFDGDQMACYFFLTEESKEDIKKKALISKNLFLEGSGELAISPNQDIIYGIYLLSKSEEGRKTLPAPLLKYMITYKISELNKKHLINFLTKYLKKYPEKYNILDDIKILGLTAASKANTTITLQNIIDSSLTVEERKPLYDNKNNMQEYLKKEKELIDLLQTRCSLAGMINSGSRGSWDQAKQLFVDRGWVTNSINEIQPEPIIGSLSEGLDSREMFLSCYGVRKGLSDVADNTAKSGSFSRSLVYLGISAIQKDNPKPCKTTKALPIFVEDVSLAKSLVGRYIFEKEEDIPLNKMLKLDRLNVLNYIGKNILLRSPLYCTGGKEYCIYCAPYKDKSKVVKGIKSHIGIIAAQSLGERATQLVLRSFHVSGLVSDSRGTNKKDKKQDKKQNKKQKHEDITSDLTSVTNIFTKPKNHGLEDQARLSEFIIKLFKIYKPHGILKLMHFELLASCLMWTLVDEEEEDYEQWRNHQDKKIYTFSINKIPELQSWLVSAAYGHFKRKIINSVGKEIGNSTFDKILIGTR